MKYLLLSFVALSTLMLFDGCDATKKTSVTSADAPHHPTSAPAPLEMKRTGNIRKTLLPNSIAFRLDATYEQIIEQAKAQNKPVFLDFYTDWCAPCKLMDESTFLIPELSGYMNTNYLNFKVNAEDLDGIPVAGTYLVRTYPTFLFIDPSTGKELARYVGSTSSAELKRIAVQALLLYRDGAGK